MGKEIKKITDEIKAAAKVVASIIIIFWVVWILDNFLLGHSLSRNGVHPREIKGLWGILFSPFLHGGLSHISNNTVGFAILSTLVLLRGIPRYIAVFVITMIVGGLGVWLIGGANTNHIGASGVIFGLFGYLLSVGIVEKNFKTILLSLFTFITYGSMLWGVLPSQPGVSWEGHLFGFIGGVGAAFLIGGRSESRG